MISGAWDFAGILAALSGFLIFGGVAFLSALHGAARTFWARGGRFADLQVAMASGEPWWFLLWLGYFAIVVGGTVALLRVRSKVTVIYHASPAMVDDTIGKALDRLGQRWERRGNRVMIGPEFAARAILEVVASPGMQTATLSWPLGAATMRRDFEAELDRILAETESLPSSVAGWLLTAAAAMFLFMIFCLGLFLLLVFRIRG
jgi:hypothetical protein